MNSGVNYRGGFLATWDPSIVGNTDARGCATLYEVVGSVEEHEWFANLEGLAVLLP